MILLLPLPSLPFSSQFFFFFHLDLMTTTTSSFDLFRHLNFLPFFSWFCYVSPFIWILLFPLPALHLPFIWILLLPLPSLPLPSSRFHSFFFSPWFCYLSSFVSIILLCSSQVLLFSSPRLQPDMCDQVLRGLMGTGLEAIDLHVVDSLTDRLFEFQHVPGQDLIARNIARGAGGRRRRKVE